MNLQAQVAQLAPDHTITRANPSNEFPGVFIGLSVPLSVAQAVAVPGGSTPEELHVTLTYLGPITDYSALDLPRFQELLHILNEVVLDHLPLTAQFSGSGRFTQAKKDVAYLGIDAPGLEALQRTTTDAARVAGFTPSTEHGFTPHCTVKYLLKDEAHPRPHPTAERFTFSTLELWLAGTRIIFLPSAGTELAKADSGPNQEQTAREVLAQLAGDQIVLDAVDEHARHLTDRAQQHHAERFEQLADAMQGVHGGPLEASILHHAEEAARARRTADVTLTPFSAQWSRHD